VEIAAAPLAVVLPGTKLIPLPRMVEILRFQAKRKFVMPAQAGIHLSFGYKAIKT
jgi:hypothetical protein